MLGITSDRAHIHAVGRSIRDAIVNSISFCTTGEIFDTVISIVVMREHAWHIDDHVKIEAHVCSLSHPMSFDACFAVSSVTRIPSRFSEEK